MRALRLSIAFLLLATVAVAAEEPLDTLKTRAEAAKPQDQDRLFARIARREVDEADRFYTEGDIPKAKERVDEVVRYAQRAGESAAKYGKHAKDTEIVLRETVRRLENLAKTLNVEDRPDVETAAQRVENIRQGVLDHMFGVKSKADK